jgi:penicillin-insensitive murein DD-endopeptidase
MKQLIFLSACLLAFACSEEPASADKQSPLPAPAHREELSAVEKHYAKYASATGESRSIGTVGRGSLENGRILPFSGNNFHYFDTNSYLQNRCFVHEKVYGTLLGSYRRLEALTPGKHYGIMECSKKHGGRIYPHRTHQNGLSVDFMTPLLKDGKPYTGLDHTGAMHYLMDFDGNGRYNEDPSVTIDFETMASHLLAVIGEAQKHGLKVEKIIWKMQLRDELFAAESGKKLHATGVYVTTHLSPLINALHDDHYHVDFGIR